MARSLSYMWAAGGAIVAVTGGLLLPGEADEPALLAIAGLAMVIAAVMRGVHGLPRGSSS